jgi:hypothetical protein
MNGEATTHECMNIVADELCNIIRETVRGVYRARPNCGLCQSKKCAIFIRGVKKTSNWKEHLTQQLLDGDLQEYLIEKEQWTAHAFNNICWRRPEIALK